MRMINQPFNGQVGNLLASLLDESEYHSVNIIVAFAKKAGLRGFANILSGSDITAERSTCTLA